MAAPSSPGSWVPPIARVGTENEASGMVVSQAESAGNHNGQSSPISAPTTAEMSSPVTNRRCCLSLLVSLRIHKRPLPHCFVPNICSRGRR